MPEVSIINSLAEVDRYAWSSLFPGEIEDYDYLRAVEASGLPGFRWRYILVTEGASLRAAAPVFVTDYKLDTTLPRGGREIIAPVRRISPRFMRLGLACLGSPCTETALTGFAPDASESERSLLRGALLEGLGAIARGEGCGLTGLKDVAGDDAMAAAALAAGYATLGAMPSAELAISFASIDAYLAGLSAGSRKDMRRKLRLRSQVRVEIRHDIADVLDRIVELYRSTLARAELSFEELTPAFFEEIVRWMDDRVLFVLYLDGEDLIGFNLLLVDGQRLLDKFFCMEAARGRALNLYFLSWFQNVEICLAKGLSTYQVGQAAYADKLRLGCRLRATTNLFRHRNHLLNGALRLASPLFSAAPKLEAAA